MCDWIIRVRGVRICGRQAYLTDTGVKLGYAGPTVSLESALEDLSPQKRQTLADSVNAIRSKLPVILAERRAKREGRPIGSVTVTPQDLFSQEAERSQEEDAEQFRKYGDPEDENVDEWFGAPCDEPIPSADDPLPPEDNFLNN